MALGRPLFRLNNWGRIEGSTRILIDSRIGSGAPREQDTSAAHGESLGEEGVRLAKRHDH